MFAVYGGSQKNPKKGPMIRYAHALLVKVDDSEREALQQDHRFFYRRIWVRTAGWAWTSTLPRSTGPKSPS